MRWEHWKFTFISSHEWGLGEAHERGSKASECVTVRSERTIQEQNQNSKKGKNC